MASPSPVGSRDKSLQPPTKTSRKTKEPARYQCNTYTKAFTRSATLRDHIRTHTDERPYKCNSCPKAFARLKDMKRHELLHNTEKKFACEGLVDVRGKSVKWGCGKKFAREDGLVAHLRPPASNCTRELAAHLCDEMTFKLWDCRHGVWTCNFKDPWKLSNGEATWMGCGRKFEGGLLLDEHLDECLDDDVSPYHDDVDKCWGAFLAHFKVEAVRRALGREAHGPQHDQQSDHPDFHSSLVGKIKVLSSNLSFGTNGTSMQMRLELPPKADSWIPFALDIGDINISDFKVRGPSEAQNSDGSSVEIYWLDFAIPDTPNTIPDSAQICLRANLKGDWTSYSYDTMILGIFKRNTNTQTESLNYADYGHGVVPSMQFPSGLISPTHDTPIARPMEGLFAYENALSSWPNSEVVSHFMDEIPITRQEHRIVADEKGGTGHWIR